MWLTAGWGGGAVGSLVSQVTRCETSVLQGVAGEHPGSSVTRGVASKSDVGGQRQEEAIFVGQ